MIFENVFAVNAEADKDPEAVRISVDTKATINIGEHSRKGKSRGLKPVVANDHDMGPKEKLSPGGVLEPKTGKAFLFFTVSHKTADFLADGIELWWENRKTELNNAKCLVINMDNGPECSGRRSRFLERMIGFSEKTGLKIHLAYYPPYHSKYNYIEHYWGGLERSWNGYLLDSVETVLKRAANFFWKSTRTTVKFIERVYEKSIQHTKKEKTIIESRLNRSKNLPWWDIVIGC